MIDLGHTILSVARHTPDGVVVFIPSYTYLDTLVAAWKRLPSRSDSIWDALRRAKRLFFEERSQAQAKESLPKQNVDSILSAYSKAVADDIDGALLFAVIGGSLSEGINFSDSLGRGVVVVGLPFPNPHSAEWKAKMQYISSKTTREGKDGKAAARDYYENACMRAVNQCIGRAIRHKNDYAAIMMLDRRYGAERIQAKLPGWIRKNLTNGADVPELARSLDEFFAGKKRTM
jgi:chromosome transmission fidelity protein 1